MNADWLGSTTHVPWRQLFLNEETWKRAVDGDSPLYDETLELVMQHRPTTVVIATGDDVIPTKNVGSPYTAAVDEKTMSRTPLLAHVWNTFSDFVVLLK